MGNVKVRSGGEWLPAANSPAILTKGLITSTFSRGFAAVWVPDGDDAFEKLADLIPAQPTSVALTNDSGRIVVTWNVSSTANLSKYQIYSATSVSGPYTLHATEPTPTGTSESFVFGRLPSAPDTRYIFVRSVAPNGLYQDSSVANITIPGLSAWSALSNSRGASGWHSRSFTFTASAQTMGSTPKSITSVLYRRANTSEGWTLVDTYVDNGVSSHTKTYTFSSYSLGQQMFRVVTTIEDNQTKQNNGTTGSGYTWTQDISTTTLTAADITGATPIISASAVTVYDPGTPGGQPNGYDYGTAREMSVSAGFSAYADRSEYTSFTIRCYNDSWGLVETKTLTIANLKSNQSIAQTESVVFGGLTRGANYIFYAQAFDPNGADPEASYGFLATDSVHSSTWAQYIGTTTSNINNEMRPTSGTSLLSAPFGPAFNPASYDALRDSNVDTWYYSKSMGASSGVYERIRAYAFSDFSINSSVYQSGSPGFALRYLRTWTPQSHNVWHQIYDNYANSWLGSGSDPSASNPYIGTANVNNNWGTSSYSHEMNTSQSGTSWYANFDARVVIGNPKTYGSSTFRVGLSEISVGTQWRNRFDNYETRTYYW